MGGAVLRSKETPDCLARLVNKKKPLGADEVALAGDRVVKNPPKMGGLIPLTGIVFVAHAVIETSCYRNKQQGKEILDTKKSL